MPDLKIRVWGTTSDTNAAADAIRGALNVSHVGAWVRDRRRPVNGRTPRGRVYIEADLPGDGLWITTRIQVTAGHVARAQAGGACDPDPVALALWDHFGINGLGLDVQEAEAGPDVLAIYLPLGVTWAADTPPFARGWMEAYDERETETGPFEFTATWRLTPESHAPGPGPEGDET